MKLILHNYRRCPFCIRTRIVLYLKNIDHEIVNEPLRKWTDWMQQQHDPRVPILRQIMDDGTEIIHRESNDINLWLDAHAGNREFTPGLDSDDYKKMINWWDWCAHELKPMIDLYKYGQDLKFDSEKHVFHTIALRELLSVLEMNLAQQQYLLGEKMTLADIAVIPFMRQIMRTREGEFSFVDFPHVLAWTNRILETDWFHDIIMAK